MLTGLYAIHLELTSMCNKNCWMCGRRNIDKNYPDIKSDYGHMDLSLLKKIAKEIPEGMVVQFHNNGEPFMYPYLATALSMFDGKIRCFDTNAKKLVEDANVVIDKLDSLTISVIENDPEADEQYNNVVEFLKIKKDKKPIMIYRLLGDVTKKPVLKYGKFPDVDYIEERKTRWEKLPGVVVRRTLHKPSGSHGYQRKVTIPEIGMCTEILNHVAIDRFGNVSVCVRFDPMRKGVIGNLKNSSLDSIWNCEKRKKWVDLHMRGLRKEIDFCSTCEYWGVPSGN